MKTRQRLLGVMPLAILSALLIAADALAVAPQVTSATAGSDRRPSVSIVAPKADAATVYVATKPNRVTDGAFIGGSIKTSDVLTPAELQAGRWVFERPLDPGTYYVLVRVSADFDACYSLGAGTFDPTCATGYSNVVQLVIPRPPSRYSARVSVLAPWKRVDLELTASPLGTKEPYRVCYLTKTKRKACTSGTLDGYSWTSPVTDRVSVSTRNLSPGTTTFTWYVGAKAVASKRVRIARS